MNPYRISIDPFKGTLKGTLIATHEPPSNLKSETLLWSSADLRLTKVKYVRSQTIVLGGSWVVISGAISPLIWVISIVNPLITLLITTHEPPSRGLNRGV